MELVSLLVQTMKLLIVESFPIPICVTYINKNVLNFYFYFLTKSKIAKCDHGHILLNKWSNKLHSMVRKVCNASL